MEEIYYISFLCYKNPPLLLLFIIEAKNDFKNGFWEVCNTYMVESEGQISKKLSLLIKNLRIWQHCQLGKYACLER